MEICGGVKTDSKIRMANRVTRYDSLWDWSTWLVLAFVLAVFLLPIFFADDMSTRVVIVIIAVVLLTVTVALFNGIILLH